MASNHNLLPTDRPVDGLLRPINSFMRLEAASGILLMVMAVIALVWANSSWSASYFGLWEIPNTTWVDMSFSFRNGAIFDPKLVPFSNPGLTVQ